MNLVPLAIAVGIPYLLVGLLWAVNHDDHLAALDGGDKLFSWLGEVVAWPILIFWDVSLR
ncbi:hypothetical protein F0U44_13845 [Nocardioides humilatus]|uniref:Uncharacterized protein n=2 Tax=Nocardioides humilatus TaxID=2607660 RepID=A0A5B1LIW1_9ACTN|nr:hypothetical protein F0U44_13845 [Nocardioides humilatus]